MFKPHITRRVALAVLVAAWTLAGCSPSETPRRPSLGPALLTLADVRRASRAPADFVDRPDEVVSTVLESQDLASVTPRLCGGPTPLAPPPKDRVLAVFTSESTMVSVSQWVYRVGPDQAQQLFERFRESMRPGCPPRQSQTPEGVQISEVLGELPLPAVGQDRFGAVMRFGIGGKVSYGLMTVVRYDSHVTHIFANAPAPIHPTFVSDLTVMAANRLEVQPA